MNYQITVLSRWGQFLYRAGLKSKYISTHGTPKDLRKLHVACQNAELLLKMQQESKRLFDAVVNAPLTAQGWRDFARLKSKMHPILQQFVNDANQYEWPTLVTACIPVADLPDGVLVETDNIPTATEMFLEGEDGNNH